MKDFLSRWAYRSIWIVLMYYSWQGVTWVANIFTLLIWISSLVVIFSAFCILAASDTLADHSKRMEKLTQTKPQGLILPVVILFFLAAQGWWITTGLWISGILAGAIAWRYAVDETEKLKKNLR